MEDQRDSLVVADATLTRAARLLSLSALLGAAPVAAQTDYYNTDAGRPVLIEDAAPVERYAFELQLAPIRMERLRGGVYAWTLEPELAYGILPRTQLEVGFPIQLTDAATATRGLAGIELSALHNLNVETLTLPALAIAVDVTLPVGNLAPDQLHPGVKLIATRTFGFARFHVNGHYSFGDVDEEAVTSSGDEDARWLAGLAVDRALPLRSALLIAATYVQQPLHAAEELRWTAEAGLRYQWSPRLAVDGGVARRFSGADQSWSITFGAAWVFAVRSLMPGTAGDN